VLTDPAEHPNPLLPQRSVLLQQTAPRPSASARLCKAFARSAKLLRICSRIRNKLSTPALSHLLPHPLLVPLVEGQRPSAAGASRPGLDEGISVHVREPCLGIDQNRGPRGTCSPVATVCVCVGYVLVCVGYEPVCVGCVLYVLVCRCV
jgi:hypothetical protein